MSRYQAYAEYKDSGVEWLGEVPEHWKARQLKYLCTYNDEVLSDSVNTNYEIEYVDIGSVSASEGITNTENITFGDAPSRARRIVRDGDVIISTVRTYLEAIALIDNPPANLIVSTGFAVIRPNNYLKRGYAAYCLRANGFIKEVIARSIGVSYPAINATDLVNIKTPEPSLDEQEKIANFLDHETAKIDALIDKQQQLIKLLKEKRQAVISHAVTKGLNPAAPMRDSGVEWLGEVPAHWEVSKVKFGYDIQLGKMLQNDSKLNGDIKINYLKAINVQWEFVSTEELPEMWASPYELKQYAIQSGDLLVCEGGEAGRAAIIDHVDGNLIIQNALHRVRGKEEFNNKFLLNFLLHASSVSWFDVLCNKATIVHFTVEKFTNLDFSYPSIQEQTKITNFLDHKTAKIDALIDKASSAIELIRERRTALISAAVTGKIDVRNFQTTGVT